MLAFLIVELVIMIPSFIDPDGALGMVSTVLLGILGLATIVPSLALTFRRLHDIDKSAWWILIGFVPIIGGLVLLVFYVLPGTNGPNKFGPDPLGGGQAEVFA